MLADLPPSSRATRLTVSAPSSVTRLPARVEPVKDTMSTSGWAAIASPTTGPMPVTRLNTPAGRPTSSMISARMKASSGATSLGLSTTVQPAARAERDLRGDLVQRVVPRRDAADDADRLAHDQRVADGLLELVALDQRRGAVEAVDRQADLDDLRQPLRHAHLVGDDGGDLVHARPEALADAGAGTWPAPRSAWPPRPGRRPWPRRRPRSTSSAVPAGMVAMTSSVAESITSRVSAEPEATQAPSM